MHKVGILGAGYIASHHVKALKLIPDLEIKAVCDTNLNQAKKIAPSIRIYSSLDEMLEKEQLDTIHVLVPPDHHFSTCEKIIKKGTDVFLEKPMCTSVSECQALECLALENNVRVGVNHNFLYYDVYRKLREAIKNQQLGPLDHVTINWQKPLGFLHSGPYDSWMLRNSRNLIIEIFPHLVGCLLDLVGKPTDFHVEASDPLTLPTGVTIFRRIVAIGYVGKTCVELRASFADAFENHTIEARGSIGTATLDFEKNTYALIRHSDYLRPLDLFVMTRNFLKQIGQESRRTLFKFIGSKFCKSIYGDPYSGSIYNSIADFYKSVSVVQSLPFSTTVIALCEQIAQKIPDSTPVKAKSNSPSPDDSAILVLGGTGFIGQALVAELVQRGQKITMLTRRKPEFSLYDNVQVIQGSMNDRATLKAVLKGKKTVYHLARANVKEWKDYLEQQVEGTRLIAEESLEAGIDRLIYTGTIDSYDAGKRDVIITETTPLDPSIESRNYYAQAKDMEEAILMKMQPQLPLTIIRPGIVIGEGSSPFHWGVGYWYHGAICRLWGNGENFLPFVLVEDVVKGLILAAENPQAKGTSFNLIDDGCLSGREYIEELSKVIGTRIEMIPTPIWKFYFWDMCKWVAKTIVRHPDRKLPSYHDWLSRTQISQYDNTKAKKVLGWKPAQNKELLIENGIIKPAKKWMI